MLICKLTHYHIKKIGHPSGVRNFFESFYLYILSRINSEKKYLLSIKDLSGRSIKSTQFKPKEGVQYVLDIPKDIPNGEYVISIEGDVFLYKKIVMSRF